MKFQVFASAADCSKPDAFGRAVMGWIGGASQGSAWHD